MLSGIANPFAADDCSSCSSDSRAQPVLCIQELLSTPSANAFKPLPLAIATRLHFALGIGGKSSLGAETIRHETIGQGLATYEVASLIPLQAMAWQTAERANSLHRDTALAAARTSSSSTCITNDEVYVHPTPGNAGPTPGVPATWQPHHQHHRPYNATWKHNSMLTVAQLWLPCPTTQCNSPAHHAVAATAACRPASCSCCHQRAVHHRQSCQMHQSIQHCRQQR